MAKKVVTEEMKLNALHQKFIKTNLHKPILDLPNEDYHGLRFAYSSSQFKDLLDDPQVFVDKYIKGKKEKIEREAFDTGTYFHTSLLEPHKVDSEIAVYSGKVRRGKEWEAFKLKNTDKMVISASQKEQGDNMISAVRSSPTAMKYLIGTNEVSFLAELHIYQGQIYSKTFNKVLTKAGWKEVPKGVGNWVVEDGYRLIVKVRADTLGDTFISDLKSTRENARSVEGVRKSISKYVYDLSAALYLDMFSLPNPELQEFIWIFAGKEIKGAKAWRASQKNIQIGRAKYMSAMIKLADCAMANWEHIDSLGEAEPMPYEMDWLQDHDSDLL